MQNQALKANISIWYFLHFLIRFIISMWPAGEMCVFQWFWQLPYFWEDTAYPQIHSSSSDSTESLTYGTCGHYYHHWGYYLITLMAGHLQGNLVCALTNTIIPPPPSYLAGNIIRADAMLIGPFFFRHSA